MSQAGNREAALRRQVDEQLREGPTESEPPDTATITRDAGRDQGVALDGAPDAIVRVVSMAMGARRKTTRGRTSARTTLSTTGAGAGT